MSYTYVDALVPTSLLVSCDVCGVVLPEARTDLHDSVHAVVVQPGVAKVSGLADLVEPLPAPAMAEEELLAIVRSKPIPLPPEAP